MERIIHLDQKISEAVVRRFYRKTPAKFGKFFRTAF